MHVFNPLYQFSLTEPARDVSQGHLWVSDSLGPPSLEAGGWVLTWDSLVGPGKCPQRS